MNSKEKKINLYCENYIDWIKAKYEQGDDIFVYYNLEKFYDLCSIASKDFMDFDFNDTYDDTNFKKINFFEKIDMVKDFLRKQMEMQLEVMSGKADAREKEAALQKLAELLAMNTRARDYISAHFRFQQVMTDIYKMIGDAVGEGLDPFAEK